MNNYRLLLEQVQNHVKLLFTTQNKSVLLYHNLSHTERVVSAATQIANHYALNDENFFIVSTAAWFHDVGYLKKPEGHEAIGAAEATDYLTSLQIEPAVSDAVSQCIIATRMPQHPRNLLEQIVCDADLFHLGTNQFQEQSKPLRKEYNALHNANISKEEWQAKTISLLQTHQYYTDYARLLLNGKKQENLTKLLEKKCSQSPETNRPSVKEKAEKMKIERPDKGIETMFRISSSNQQKLSDLADNKSHILITVNSIIISVVASLLLRKLDTNDYLVIPAIMLLLVSLITIVFSILATRPNIPSGTFTNEELENKKVNLLFFGNFYRMSLDSYMHGMKEVMNDRDFLYSTLIRDVYSQGVVLGRKYKLLRAAYNIFMFGLIVSVIAFIIASLLSA